MEELVKIEIYVPLEYEEPLRMALAEAGAGRIGRYDSCVFVTHGTGYFRPLAGADPFLGEKNRIEAAEECKLELQCSRALVPEVLRAIRRAHPYEEPVVHVIPLLCL